MNTGHIKKKTEQHCNVVIHQQKQSLGSLSWNDLNAVHCSAGFIQGCEGHPRNPISCKSTTDITTSTTTSTYGICVYMCYPTSWLHSWVRRTPTESAQRSNQLKNWITQHATLGEEDFRLQAFAASDAAKSRRQTNCDVLVIPSQLASSRGAKDT